MQNLIFRQLHDSTRSPTKTQIIIYWVATAIIALESLAGGVADIMQEPGYINILSHLGYPVYFAIILGVWKVLAVVAILVPRYPRLKEWAYAGLVFQFTGAKASYIIVGDGVVVLVAPFVFLCLVITSWLLRPPSRRVL
jgi:DoxX-like family